MESKNKYIVNLLVLVSAVLIAYGIIFKNLYAGLFGYLVLLVSVIVYVFQNKFFTKSINYNSQDIKTKNEAEEKDNKNNPISGSFYNDVTKFLEGSNPLRGIEAFDSSLERYFSKPHKQANMQFGYNAAILWDEKPYELDNYDKIPSDYDINYERRGYVKEDGNSDYERAYQ